MERCSARASDRGARELLGEILEVLPTGGRQRFRPDSHCMQPFPTASAPVLLPRA